MRVEVQLQQAAALNLNKQQVEPKKIASQGEAGVSQLVEDVEKLGLKLVPVHPGQTHALLVPYFFIEVPDRQTAERVINLLKHHKIIEAAYLKPEEAAP